MNGFLEAALSLNKLKRDKTIFSGGDHKYSPPRVH